jgi:hypothetical protein
MRRLAISLAQLACRDNLVLAAHKAARGKHHRPAVVAWLAQLDERVAALSRRILAGQAPRGQQQRFVIHDPKRRVITAGCLDDRVLHHAILNLAEPRFEGALCDSVFACRPGLGVHAALAAMQRGLQRNAWAVQVDVAGYFPSIDHAVLLAQLARRFKGAEFLALLGRIVASGAPVPGLGLPIGALTSQHFANAYLDSADRLLLGHAGVGAHVRYMDDIVWFCNSRSAAQDSLARLQEHLGRVLKLQLKPGVVLQPCGQGLRFCGYRVRPGVILSGSRKMQRYRRAQRRLQQAQALGAVDADLQRAHDSNLAAMHPAQSLHFRQRLWGQHL